MIFAYQDNLRSMETSLSVFVEAQRSEKEREREVEQRERESLVRIKMILKINRPLATITYVCKCLL